MKEFDANRALSDLNLKADWVSLREVEEIDTYRVIRDGKPESNSRDRSHGVMVEVLEDGQFGYCGTNRLDQPGIQEAAERAQAQAKLSAQRGVHNFGPDARPPAKGSYKSPRKMGPDSIPPGELNQLLIRQCEALRISPKIKSVTALARTVESNHRFVSSNGSDTQQDFLLISSFLSATAEEDGQIQRRTDGGLLARSYQAGFEVLDEATLLKRAQQVGEQALELLAADSCPNETCDLVLAPDQLKLQVHESVGHPLEIDRILGDERNYAGWSFVQPEDFGKLQYGSDLMNITFDPAVEGEHASYSFDDTGVPARKEYIIKDGLLLRGLGGLESQMRSGIAGVANARASSYNRPAIDRMANLNLEPGDSSFDEIIGSVERGVYMETNRSWSIDDFRRKFQFGCEYARLIENGKFTKVLKNPNYRDITTKFWRNLKKLGNRDTFQVYGSPFCGKGEPNQIIRVGHATPLALFANVEVFGGVK